MSWEQFAQRSREAEWLDGADYAREEYLEFLADLRRVNRRLGVWRALARRLFPLILKTGLKQVRMLDVGAASADIPIMIVEWGRVHGVKIDFTVIDLNRLAVSEAKAQSAAYPEIKVVCANAFDPPFPDRAFDFVLASHFLHHFDEEDAVVLLRGFARLARVAFLVNDLRRHPLAYYSFKVLSRLFTRNRMVRHDGAVSVLRGFTDSELEALGRRAGLELDVYRHFPYRYIFIGSTNHDDRGSTANL